MTSPTTPGWAPTHQHKKGGLYRVLTHGVLEADHTPVVIYDDVAGQVWVRPVSEFDDGRFRPLVPATDPPAPLLQRARKKFLGL